MNDLMDKLIRFVLMLVLFVVFLLLVGVNLVPA
jgi:hypothetical protein